MGRRHQRTMQRSCSWPLLIHTECKHYGFPCSERFLCARNQNPKARNKNLAVICATCINVESRVGSRHLTGPPVACGERPAIWQPLGVNECAATVCNALKSTNSCRGGKCSAQFPTKLRCQQNISFSLSGTGNVLGDRIKIESHLRTSLRRASDALREIARTISEVASKSSEVFPVNSKCSECNKSARAFKCGMASTSAARRLSF